MDLSFEDPFGLFPYKVAGSIPNLADRLPDTSPLRAVYLDWEQRFIAMLLQHWGKKYSILISRLRQLFPDKAIKQDEVWVIDELDDLWFAWGTGYYEEMLPYIEEAIGIGAIAGGNVLGQMFNAGWDPVSTHTTIAEWARQHTAKLVVKKSRMFRRTLTENDIRAIRASIGNWLDSGLPFDDLVSRINEVVVNPYRARMIAATESTRAYAEGARIVWRESNVIEFERWNTANDELVCAICGERAGTVTPLDTLEYGAHINCRCWPTPVAGAMPSLLDDLGFDLGEYV